MSSRPAPLLTACLLLASLVAITPSAAATEVCVPDLPEEIRVFFEHAGPAASRFVLVPPDCVTIPDEQYPPQWNLCDSQLGAWVEWLGLRAEVCVQPFPGGACVMSSLNGATFVDWVCLDDNGSGNPCLSNYSGGALAPPTSDRVCLDKNAEGEGCVSHYSTTGSAVRVCAEFDDNGDACPTLYVDATPYDRACVLDNNDPGYGCVSNYLWASEPSVRACADVDDRGALCPSVYSDGDRLDRACVLDANDPGLGCVSDYVGDGSTSARACADQDDAGHLCPSTYANGERLDRTCAEDEERATCASNYWADGRVRARACRDDDGDVDHPCVTVYAEDARRDRACAEPEGPVADPDVVCASNTVDGAGRLAGCLDPSTDGQAGHACATLFLDATQPARACNDPEPGLTLCASAYTLDGYGTDRTCVGEYPEGLCVAHSLAAADQSLEVRTCQTKDEHDNDCLATTLSAGGSPAVASRTCPDADYPEGECHAQRVVATGSSAEARTCQSTDPETGQPCAYAYVFRDAVPQEPLGRCVPTKSDCEEGEVGVVLDGERHCQQDPCPALHEAGTPGESIVVLCGHPVPDACPVASIDPATVAACGQGPHCEGSVQPGSGPTLATACGREVPNPCPEPTGSAPGALVVVCGEPVPDPCPGLVGVPPGYLLYVCGQYVDDPDDPCPQGVDAWTVAACGVVSPQCPDGLYTTDAGGRPTAVCGNDLPSACPEPVTFPSGSIVAVCGVPVGHPCPQLADVWTVAACGIIGPQCPGGLYGMDGSGALAHVCGQPAPELCEAPVGPLALGQPTFTVCGQVVPNPAAPYARDCMDGLDNDGDGRTDYAPAAMGGGDAGCLNPFDDDERA